MARNCFQHVQFLRGHHNVITYHKNFHRPRNIRIYIFNMYAPRLNVGECSWNYFRRARFFAPKRNSRRQIVRVGKGKKTMGTLKWRVVPQPVTKWSGRRTCASVKRRRGGKFALDIRKRGLSKQNVPGYKGSETHGSLYIMTRDAGYTGCEQLPVTA